MRHVRKGAVVCVIDYPRNGEIYETTVISSGNKYIKVQEFPYLKFDATTLYNIEGGGGLYVGSMLQYSIAKKQSQERAAKLELIKRKLTELSTSQLRDIDYQINQMLK